MSLRPIIRALAVPVLGLTLKDDTTSLSTLTESEWMALSATWARGADYVVRKVGRRWTVNPSFGGDRWPLYRTKALACAAVDAVVLAESSRRARLAR